MIIMSKHQIKFQQILTCHMKSIRIKIILQYIIIYLAGLETSLAPHGVILYLDHTDGVIGPFLEHFSYFMKCVLHDVILQNVII